MKRRLLFICLLLCTHVVLAEPPAPRAAGTGGPVEELVNKQLVLPLKKAESRRSRFSRAAPVPVQRRVRVLDTAAHTDSRGKEFVRFAIDERRAWDEKSPWEKDSVTGCAYLQEHEVFVQHGEAFVPATSLLGRDAKERPGVCHAVADGAG